MGPLRRRSSRACQGGSRVVALAVAITCTCTRTRTRVHRLTGIGVGVGLAFGLATGWVLRFVRWRGVPAYVEALLTLTIAYLAFYTAQSPAEVSLGLFSVGTCLPWSLSCFLHCAVACRGWFGCIIKPWT